MIMDTSALLAILFDEPDAESYARALAAADTLRLSAGSFVEAAIVVEAQTDASGRGRAGIVIELFTEEQAHIARQAYTDFGKGRHPAGLNSGDCFAYASQGQPPSRCSSRAGISARPTSQLRSRLRRAHSPPKMTHDMSTCRPAGGADRKHERPAASRRFGGMRAHVKVEYSRQM